MKLKFAFLSAALIIFALAPLSAFSKPGNREQPSAPTMQEVFVNFDSGEISIVGVGFDEPTFYLGMDETPLNIISVETNLVVLELPESLVNGDYVLRVVDGNTTSTYDLTIGDFAPKTHIGQVCPEGEHVIGFDELGGIICSRLDIATLHFGKADPVSEGWILTSYYENSASGGSEQTASGLFDYWQIRDVSTATRSFWNYIRTVGENATGSGWVAEAVVRVVEAPVPEGWNFGTQNLLIYDGCTVWGIRLSDDSIALHPREGTISPFTEELDTRTDYRQYRIEFRPNGSGLEDDTIDVYADGERVFSEVRRDNFEICVDSSSPYPYVWFGSGNSVPVGTANWNKIQFSRR